MMMKDWTVFSGVPRKVKMLKPHVTLTKHKDMYLNAKAVEALGTPEAIRFFFDVSRSLIGIRQESPDVEQAFTLHLDEKKSGTTGKIHAGIFCNFFGVNPEYTITFHDIRVDGDGIMILDLKTATRVRRW